MNVFLNHLKPVNVEEIIAAAMEAEPKMTLIMKEVIKEIKMDKENIFNSIVPGFARSVFVYFKFS